MKWELWEGFGQKRNISFDIFYRISELIKLTERSKSESLRQLKPVYLTLQEMMVTQVYKRTNC